MLFTSGAFLFVFLPITLLVFFATARVAGPAPPVAWEMALLAIGLLITARGAWKAGKLADYYLNTSTTRDRDVAPGWLAVAVGVACIVCFVRALALLYRQIHARLFSPRMTSSACGKHSPY